MDSHGVRPILLVEDNPVDVDLTLRAFARRTPRQPIEVARDGEEALAMIPRWEGGHPLPRVVLLDIKLPRISGLEVLREFRRHPVTARMPVVMLSSSGHDQDVEQAYQLLANSYVLKPVQFESFVDVAAQIERYWCALNRLPR